jgi:hypothetical protein
VRPAQGGPCGERSVGWTSGFDPRRRHPPAWHVARSQSIMPYLGCPGQAASMGAAGLAPLDGAEAPRAGGSGGGGLATYLPPPCDLFRPSPGLAP